MLILIDQVVLKHVVTLNNNYHTDHNKHPANYVVTAYSQVLLISYPIVRSQYERRHIVILRAILVKQWYSYFLADNSSKVNHHQQLKMIEVVRYSHNGHNNRQLVQTHL